MKTLKTLLALAVMMVMIMPSCKKTDLTKNSTNPYIAIFKTAEESIGIASAKSDTLMKAAGWTYSAQNAKWSKKVGDLAFTIQYSYNNSTNVIYMAEFIIESANGKTDTFSEKNYITFLKMLGESYKVNSTGCDFAEAGYGDTPDDQNATKFTNYSDFKKAFKKFVAAPVTSAIWGKKTMGILIDSQISGSNYFWEGTIVDSNVM